MLILIVNNNVTCKILELKSYDPELLFASQLHTVFLISTIENGMIGSKLSSSFRPRKLNPSIVYPKTLLLEVSLLS